MKLTRRDQTVLGLGLSICGALFLLSGTISEGAGLAIGIIGIATLASRPPKAPEASDREASDDAS